MVTLALLPCWSSVIMLESITASSSGELMPLSESLSAVRLSFRSTGYKIQHLKSTFILFCAKIKPVTFSLMNRALLRTQQNVNVVGDYINITTRKLTTLYVILFSFAVNTT